MRQTEPMSPSSGGRRGTTSSSLLPLVSALCALIVARELLQLVLPGLSYWVVFVIALVVGWVTYAMVERFVGRRNPPRNGERR